MMKRRGLLLVLLALLLLSLTACGFVQYVEHREEQETTVPDSLEEYLALLKELLFTGCTEDQQSAYDFALLEAENELRECESTEAMQAVYEKHNAALRDMNASILGEIFQSLAEEQIYRSEEQLEVEELIDEYIELVWEANSGAEITAALYEFKTELGLIKTDKQLYNEELAELKAEKIEALGDVNYALYRDAQRTRISQLVVAFEGEVAEITTKAACLTLYEVYRQEVLALPGAAALLAAERAEAIAQWQEKLGALAQKYDCVPMGDIDALLLQMQTLSVVEANRAGGEFILAQLGEVATREELQEATRTVIENAALTAQYRKNDQASIRALQAAALTALAEKTAAAEMQTLIGELDTAIALIPTNDARWAKSLADFRAALLARYGTYVLHEPASLTAASSYLELGQIIDYYAFYQLDGTSFVSDTFRVQLNFPHRYAEWELVEVHWYCELIRSAVGLLGYFEEDSSQMVFTLVPYAFATQTNREGEANINRHPTMIEFNSDPDAQSVRGDDFEDFPYLSLYTKRLEGIWNSQQLWYALEHEYIPVVVPGSPAARVLERAKQILRTVIRDGMSTEEKIFRLYSWFAENVEYDYVYYDFLEHEDRELLPDHLTAVFNSFHIEGALFDGMAVCCGYAKAYLLMLRMEGIESYRLALNYAWEHTISDMGGITYGSHALVAVRASDGKFYYSDVEQSFAKNNTLSRYHQLLVPHQYQNAWHYGSNPIFGEVLDFGTELPLVMWDKLMYNGKSLIPKSVEELQALLDDFADHPNKEEMLMLFAYPAYDFPVTSTILADGRFDLWVFTFGGFYEYYVYPAK